MMLDGGIDRGIMLLRTFIVEVSQDETGREVTLVKRGSAFPAGG